MRAGAEARGRSGDQGAAYVFELEGDDWVVGSRGGGYLFARDDEGFRLLAAPRADDGVPGDHLGVGAALTDDEAFLGAPDDDAPGQPPKPRQREPAP